MISDKTYKNITVVNAPSSHQLCSLSDTPNSGITLGA